MSLTLEDYYLIGGSEPRGSVLALRLSRFQSNNPGASFFFPLFLLLHGTLGQLAKTLAQHRKTKHCVYTDFDVLSGTESGSNCWLEIADRFGERSPPLSLCCNWKQLVRVLGSDARVVRLNVTT